MNNNHITEIYRLDLIQINGGVNEEAYASGKAAGEVVGAFVGTMINDFLKVSGLWKIISLL